MDRTVRRVGIPGSFSAGGDHPGNWNIWFSGSADAADEVRPEGPPWA
ncbi:hypothetical protein [Streptomyces bauhiniae]|uniref:Uncharacterized protein n=1 Tax=Streptomyces bauhiniae TaxID=2340725 RepID=A0A7K3R2F9_9ACTN|nr:hypothetical protein [Streptomyces bauhiniae]NEB96334.1 hypothetical protein [Streptomyces bauhiniae]